MALFATLLDGPGQPSPAGTPAPPLCPGPCSVFQQATGWVVSVLLAALLAPGSLAAPPQKSAPDLTSISLEDLLNVEVTSVTRREQKLSQSASAIYVISKEDIRRSGATTIPDALRLAPGVYIGQLDANKWVVGIRGFNGRFSNKLLVMIDGRSVYHPAFAGVYWEANDVLLEDIERIEVIRGPGATLWGSNAVNGVINIITKRSTDTQGVLVTATGGDQEGAGGAVRYGGQAGSTLHYRIYSRYFSRSGAFFDSGERANDNWLKMQGGFRADWEISPNDSATFSGDAYDASAGDRQGLALLVPPYQTNYSYRASFSGANILARWTHRYSERSSTQVQFFYDYSTRDDVFIHDTSASVTDTEVQQQFDFSRHRLIGGVGFRTNDDDQPSDWNAHYDPHHRTTHRVNTFLEDEISLVPNRLVLTVGSKFENNTFTNWEIQPSASLLWSPSLKTTVWIAAARAARSPSRVDHDLIYPSYVFPNPDGSLTEGELVGNSNIRPEHMNTYEVGYRLSPRRSLSLDLTGFYNVYTDLSTVVSGSPPFSRPGPPLTVVVPLTFENVLSARVYGTEMAAAWKPAPSIDLRANYSYLRGGKATPADIPGPAHQFQARWYWTLPHRIEWDSGYYFVDALAGVAAYHRVDSRLGWRPDARCEFSVTVQNLLDNRHPDAPPVLSLANEIGRSIYGKITWRLPGR